MRPATPSSRQRPPNTTARWRRFRPAPTRPCWPTRSSPATAALAATVTEGSPEVYSEIQAAFDGADEVAAAAQRIADADSDTFADLYAEAKRNVDADSRVTDE